MTPAELLLHPVRLRIVQAFLGDRTLTIGDLRAELPDVPSASLYRQVATLSDAGVLHVVDERRVRGAVERSYRLELEAASLSAEDTASMTVDEHRHGFLTFVAGLLADYDRYLERGDVDLGRDLVGYRQAAVHLTDQEMRELLDDLRAVIRPRLQLPASQGRRRRLVTTILMPG